MMQNKKGFTLIELLIVVVIIGILAAIAIPKFANTKEKAYLTAMKSDLRNLVTAQEAYFSNGAVYAATLPSTAFALSTGNQSLVITPDGGLGWSAVVENTATTITCRIGVGTGVTSPDGEGEPVCLP
jgi:type IV pilus assembly protein PilA